METAYTHWDRARLQTLDELRQFERSRAIEDIARLMSPHEISIDDVRERMAGHPHVSEKLSALEAVIPL